MSKVGNQRKQNSSIKMRTKSIERKRYSLRISKSKNNSPSRNVDPKDETEKKSSEKSEQKYKEITENNVTGSVKRKSGKPMRTLRNESEMEEDGICISKSGASPPKIQSTLSKNDRDIGVTAKIKIEATLEEKPTSSASPDNGDTPVYEALQHAIACQSTSGCSYLKCSIAKQFLTHSATCTKGSNDCTICKAMDIMICKHSQVCNVPLEKCCPIPSCDKVRLMVLEEWVKLKHKHNEMMQRVFRALIHAKKCRDKECDLLLCKNVKSVLLHTHHCVENEKCKTKRFIIQLCEHHQQMCCSNDCEVEFCQNAIKRRKEEELLKMSLMNQRDAQLEQESAIQNLQSAESMSDQGSTTQPVTNFKNSSNFMPHLQPQFIPWPANFASTNQYFFPNGLLPYPYGMDVQHINEVYAVNEPSATVATDKIFPQSQEKSEIIPQIPHSQPAVGLFNEITSGCNTHNDAANSTSPTDEMYLHLWREKENGTKSSLPRLSPSELHNILLPRGEGVQLLSPVTDNRANYSEVNSLSQQDLSPQSSQESELEENPIPLTNYETTKPLSNQYIPSKHECIYSQQQLLQARNEGNEAEFKSQADWSKIDFLKQQMLREEMDVETETADETDSDGISKTEDTVDGCSSLHHRIDYGFMSALERNYLHLMEEQKLV